MTDKKLEFKHAHITGQAMRDHWGPIVDRIAAETADWRDEWIYDLVTETERLREALKKPKAWLVSDGKTYWATVFEPYPKDHPHCDIIPLYSAPLGETK